MSRYQYDATNGNLPHVAMINGKGVTAMKAFATREEAEAEVRRYSDEAEVEMLRQDALEPIVRAYLGES